MKLLVKHWQVRKMNIVGIVVVSIILLITVLSVVTLVKAQQLKGEKIATTGTKIDAFVKEKSKALLYFYSPRCGQCPAVTVAVDKLKQDGLHVMKMDISKHHEVAKALNIRATPTVLFIENQHISKVLLGAKGESEYRALLA